MGQMIIYEHPQMQTYKQCLAYCDFEGTSGVNFRNFAVMGTPTMFLINSEGVIIEKVATVKQLIN